MSFLKFDFLGFTFIYQSNMWLSKITRKKYPVNLRTIIIRPSQKKFFALKKKLKILISKNNNLTAIELLEQINPILQCWIRYFSLFNNKKIFYKIDEYVYQRLWRWCIRKHPNLSKSHLADKYFLMGAKNSVMSPDNKKWHFHGRSVNNIKFLILLSIKAKHNFIPFFVKKAALNFNSKNFFVFKSRILKQEAKQYFNDVCILYNQQKGKCLFCNLVIEFSFSEKKFTEIFKIHYAVYSCINTLYNKYNKKCLLHKLCYNRVDKLVKKNIIKSFFGKILYLELK